MSHLGSDGGSGSPLTAIWGAAKGGKENVEPLSANSDEEWMDSLLKLLAAAGVHPKVEHEPARNRDRGSDAVDACSVEPDAVACNSQVPVCLAEPDRSSTGDQADATEIALVEATATEQQITETSAHYDPRTVGAQLDDGTEDMYRDDVDPGYRVLMVSAAELLASMRERYYAQQQANAPPQEGGSGGEVGETVRDDGIDGGTGGGNSQDMSASTSLGLIMGVPAEVMGSPAVEFSSTYQPYSEPAAHSEIGVASSGLESQGIPVSQPDASSSVPASVGETEDTREFACASEAVGSSKSSSTTDCAASSTEAAVTVYVPAPVGEASLASAAAASAAAIPQPHALGASRRRCKKHRNHAQYQHAPSGDPFYPVECDGIVYDSFALRVVYERDRTGFEESKEFPVEINSIVAGRYQVLQHLGSAAFSRAVQCLDLRTDQMVCMKIIKNEKDFVDQSMDEIKLLRLIETNCSSVDEKHCLRILDYFYHKEHLIIVTELLRDNLYEFSKYNREYGQSPYFTLGRLQQVTRQLLVALEYVHSLWLIHADLKPENILIKSYSRCEVKLIDFGSSCYVDDPLSSYVQSRSYRAPEVILGMPYNQKIDVWSLGCVIAELWSGFVLFQNDSVQSLLARIAGIIGPFPQNMFTNGRFSQYYFTQDGWLYREHDPAPTIQAASSDPAAFATAEAEALAARRIHLLLPKRSSLKQRMRTDDEVFLDFLASVLRVDPQQRLTAKEALEHPWLAPGLYPDGLQVK